jgi:hypothetical protein
VAIREGQNLLEVKDPGAGERGEWGGVNMIKVPNLKIKKKNKPLKI